MRQIHFRKLLAVLVLVTTPVGAAEVGRFWNLTGETITSLTMAPAGTATFGGNQCANDKDGSVDNDERLRLTEVRPGRYDVRVTLAPSGRMCVAHDVTVKEGTKVAFSLEPKDLTDCR